MPTSSSVLKLHQPDRDLSWTMATSAGQPLVGIARQVHVQAVQGGYKVTLDKTVA
jgi:hypothetical protein